MDEVIAELESDKATFELTAERVQVLLQTVAKRRRYFSHWRTGRQY